MIGLISAPTNLGLRPPSRGTEPGTAKAPEALRQAALFRRFGELGALDGGAVRTAPYGATTWPGHVRNEAAILDHARRLSQIIGGGAIRVGADEPARRLLATAGQNGYWFHLDVDVLDPRWMPAVDSPDPGGLSPEQLVELLTRLPPQACGAQITVFDPDLDPDGRYAELITEIAVTGLKGLGSASGG